MLSHPLPPPEPREAGGTPRKLSVKLLLPTPREALPPGRAPSRARTRTHILPCLYQPPSQVVAVARRVSPWAAGGRLGEGGSHRATLPEASVCAPRVGAAGHRPGDEGPALTGKRRQRDDGSKRIRDGSAPGGGSRQGGRLWQRALRCWPAGRLATRTEGTRGALRVRHPALSSQLSKLQVPLYPPSAPGVNNFFTPLHPRPSLRQPGEFAAPRGPGTSGAEMWP